MNSRLIFDVGMYNGDDTAYYLHRGFKVLAIEANPRMVEKCKLRFENAIATGRLTILNVGIHRTFGSYPFYINEDISEWSSFNREIACRGGKNWPAVEVPGVPFEDVLEQYGIPFYLKIDIEGHDDYCVRALPKDDLPKYISFEAGPRGLEHLSYCASLGYNAFKCISQENHRFSCPLVPRPLRTRLVSKALRVGRRMFRIRPQGEPWRFSRGSSGPFGEDTDGDWVSLEEVISRWLSYKEEYKKRGFTYECWYDFHATIR